MEIRVKDRSLIPVPLKVKVESMSLQPLLCRLDQTEIENDTGYSLTL